ncbi:hypothetical protein BASA81_000725 [Batrachochytrium salamandrivorans]|nr:hypothetical protein BASA81_000725 [Batrachochytrium salamandrivorans]
MENAVLVTRRKASEQEAKSAIESFLARKRENVVELTKRLVSVSFPRESEVKLSAEKEMALGMCFEAIREHLEENLEAQDYDSSDNEEEQLVEQRSFLTSSERRRMQSLQKREERFSKRAPKKLPVALPTDKSAKKRDGGKPPLPKASKKLKPSAGE